MTRLFAIASLTNIICAGKSGIILRVTLLVLFLLKKPIDTPASSGKLPIN